MKRQENKKKKKNNRQDKFLHKPELCFIWTSGFNKTSTEHLECRPLRRRDNVQASPVSGTFGGAGKLECRYSREWEKSRSGYPGQFTVHWDLLGRDGALLNTSHCASQAVRGTGGGEGKEPTWWLLSHEVPTSDFPLVSVGEVVGLQRELGQNSEQSPEVIVKLVLQVRVVVQEQLPGDPLLLLLLLHRHLQEAGPAAHLPLQQAPLHVVLDGLEQQVVLVHVPLLVGARRLVVVALHRLAGRLLLQRHVSQQARHHDGLVHVVGGRYEAVHDVDEGVLVAGGVAADLHHLEGFCCGVELGGWGCWGRALLSGGWSANENKRGNVRMAGRVQRHQGREQNKKQNKTQVCTFSTHTKATSSHHTHTLKNIMAAGNALKPQQQLPHLIHRAHPDFYHPK